MIIIVLANISGLIYIYICIKQTNKTTKENVIIASLSIELIYIYINGFFIFSGNGRRIPEMEDSRQ